MIINEEPRIKYICPVCGHYFYESSLISYSSFCINTTCFTDGYNSDFYRSGFIQCSRCKSIFHSQYLNKINLNEEEHARITSSEFRDEYFKKTGCAWYDCLDGDYFGLPLSTETFSKRWWRHSSRPIYFPDGISEEERQEVQTLFYINTWRIAHFRHLFWIRESALTMEKYMQAGAEILKSLYEYTSETDDFDNRIRLDLLIVKAELLRNNHKYEECLSDVDYLIKNHTTTLRNGGFLIRLETIRTAAQQCISQTLPLPINKNRRW